MLRVTQLAAQQAENWLYPPLIPLNRQTEPAAFRGGKHLRFGYINFIFPQHRPNPAGIIISC